MSEHPVVNTTTDRRTDNYYSATNYLVCRTYVRSGHECLWKENTLLIVPAFASDVCGGYSKELCVETAPSQTASSQPSHSLYGPLPRIGYYMNIIYYSVAVVRKRTIRRLTQDLHNATSQKTTFFMVTAVKASNHVLIRSKRLWRWYINTIIVSGH
jgi:hypothetical protein